MTSITRSNTDNPLRKGTKAWQERQDVQLTNSFETGGIVALREALNTYEPSINGQLALCLRAFKKNNDVLSRQLLSLFPDVMKDDQILFDICSITSLRKNACHLFTLALPFKNDTIQNDFARTYIMQNIADIPVSYATLTRVLDVRPGKFLLNAEKATLSKIKRLSQHKSTAPCLQK